MARITALVAVGVIIAIVSYATEPTFGLFVIGLMIVCLTAYGVFQLWQALRQLLRAK
jgi:hypothetical protein